jgi:hypothetical protein
MRPFLILGLQLVVSAVCFGQGHYPLAIGNRWDYGYLDFTPGQPNHFVYTHTVAVVADTVMENGKTYAVLSDGSFLREERDTVYDYFWAVGERIRYDFSQQAGDTVFRYLPSDTLITTVYRGTNTFFGRAAQYWVFNSQASRSTFYTVLTLVDGFGYFHGQYEPGEIEYCLGALIDGVAYGTLTDVPPGGETSPNGFALSQNYPNPFNPTTSIRLTIVNRQWTIVRVFDLLGREVATLVNEVKDPGTYTVRFDGAHLSSGVYICRLQSGGSSQSRRMTLVK